MRRWLLAGGTVGAVAVAATVGVAIGSRDHDSNTASATTPAADLNLTPVVRRDLARNEELDGTTGYGAESELMLPQEGTLTSLPQPGTAIDQRRRDRLRRRSAGHRHPQRCHAVARPRSEFG